MTKHFNKFLTILFVINLLNTSLLADEGKPTKEERLVKVSGKVVDAETGEELTGVRFFFEGEDEVFYSDPMGAFDIEAVAGAEAKLTISYISYENKIVEVKDSDFFLIKLSRKK
ncbi:MAG: carboxypeptidase-like regulatory domain-containing protein [Chloroflexia bacterium]|nr:carboxypeptidase-like regulatory domain-containing protein [Chloroflexia bacterium]